MPLRSKKPKTKPNLESPLPLSREQLRDQLAASVISGIFASRPNEPLPGLINQAAELAAVGYVVADQMLEMRRFSDQKLKAWLALQLNKSQGFKKRVEPTKEEQF
jgi:hypothetical protein